MDVLYKLNRFTTLPFLIDILKRKKISLLNPVFWDDYNDKAIIEVYKEIRKIKGLYAICFTNKSDTVHHWKAFSGGNSGCCIAFKGSQLINHLKKQNIIIHGEVEYKRISDLKTANIPADKIPFTKRRAFYNENEYRIIMESQSQNDSFDFDLDLTLIRKITLSSTLPKETFNSIKESLIKLCPMLSTKIRQSTLYKNRTWIDHFKTKIKKNRVQQGL